MNTRKAWLRRALLLVAVCGVHTSVRAQTQRSSGGGEAQKFMQQYQQLAAEKTALQGQLAQLKKDLDAAKSEVLAAKKERDLAKAHVGVAPASLAQATSAREIAERTLDKYKQQTGELVTRFRETATNLREVESDRDKLTRTVADRDKALDQCATNNLTLYDINSDILNRLEHVGVFTKASAVEPFTKITRTRMENLVDEYRERAQQLRVKKAAP